MVERLRAGKFASTASRRSPTPPPVAAVHHHTLQQEANRKLRFGSRRTMQIAQRLYENGHITYMRTDSTTLSELGDRRSIRDAIESSYGAEYLSRQPRQYQTKVKNAQEAHEAIRPASDVRDAATSSSATLERRRAASLRADLEAHHGLPDGGSARAPHRGRVRGEVAPASARRRRARRAGQERRAVDAIFQARGKTIEFPGFLRAYVEGSDDPESELAEQEVLLPRGRARRPARGAAARARATTPRSRRRATPRRR